jgi:hypothetical protein
MSNLYGRPPPAPSGIEQTILHFEDATLAPADFTHEVHIQVAWWYVQQYGLLAALTRFTAAIKRLTQTLGVADKYHETMTWFYLIKIAERCRLLSGADWPTFKAANPDLFARNPGLLNDYYTDDLLRSAQARCGFVLPDRLR